MTRPLSILQVAASVAYEDGGPATAILELNRTLNQLACRSHVITTDAVGVDGHLGPQGRARIQATGASVSIHRVHFPRRLKSSIPLAVDFWRRSRTADVVHIHGLYLFHTAVAALICWWRRVPYVLQPHGTMEPYQRKFSAGRKWAYDCLIGNVIRRRAAFILFATQSEARHAADLVPDDQSVVAGLGAHLPELPPDYTPVWAKDLPDGPTVLFLGRIAAKKRVDRILEAWPQVAKQVSGAQLLLVGSDDIDLRRRWEARSGSRPDVQWMGLLTGADKTWALRRADVFVLPSENENFAISVAETILAGTPPVVTAEVAMSEFVAAHDAGWVLSDGSVDAITGALVSLLLDDARRSELAANCRLAAPQLSWETSARRFVAAYAAAAGAPST